MLQIFVSHAPIDNDGNWIVKTVTHIEKMLRQNALMSSIFIKIDSHSSLEIQTELENSAIFIAFLSRSYFASFQCRKELTDFVSRVGSNSGRLYILNLDRAPLPDDLNPKLYTELNAIGGYQFWIEDKEMEICVKLATKGGRKGLNTYYRLIYKVASDITTKLESMSSSVIPITSSYEARNLSAQVTELSIPERKQVLDRLNRMLCAEFETILFTYGVPSDILSTTNQKQRAIDLVRYAENRNELGLLQQTILEIQPNPDPIPTSSSEAVHGQVFLASAPQSLMYDRSRLQTYFEQRGLTVLDPSQSHSTVAEMLETADCFVQLLDDTATHECLKAEYELAKPKNIPIFQWYHPEANKVKIAIISDNRDDHWLTKLKRQLTLLEQDGFASLWDLKQIGSGEEIELSIDTSINEAKVIILLLSGDFLASERYQKYRNRLCGFIRDNDKVVIPVISRPCNWQLAFPGIQPFNNIPLSDKNQDADAIFKHLDARICDMTGFFWRHNSNIKRYSLYNLGREIVEYCLHINTPATAVTVKKDSEKTVFVDMTQADKHLTDNIRQFFIESSIKCCFPITLDISDIDDTNEIFQDWLRNLENCDAILIVYQNTSEKWINQRLYDYSKHIHRRQRPLKFLAISHPPGYPGEDLSWSAKLAVELLFCPTLTDANCLPKVVTALEGESI